MCLNPNLSVVPGTLPMLQPSQPACVSSISCLSNTSGNLHPTPYAACVSKASFLCNIYWSSFSGKKTSVQRIHRTVQFQPVTRFWMCGMLPSILRTSSSSILSHHYGHANSLFEGRHMRYSHSRVVSWMTLALMDRLPFVIYEQHSARGARYNPEGRRFDSRWCHRSFWHNPSGRTMVLELTQPLI